MLCLFPYFTNNSAYKDCFEKNLEATFGPKYALKFTISILYLDVSGRFEKVAVPPVVCIKYCKKSPPPPPPSFVNSWTRHRHSYTKCYFGSGLTG